MPVHDKEEGGFSSRYLEACDKLMTSFYKECLILANLWWYWWVSYRHCYNIHVLCSTTVYTALLGPGDMLTIPPFWLHHVETLEESVSVNVWSDSPEYATINEM